MFNSEKFATAIRIHRKAKSQTFRQAAQEIGTTPGTLFRIEGGSEPTMTTFIKICAWAGWLQRAHLFFKQ